MTPEPALTQFQRWLLGWDVDEKKAREEEGES